MLLGVMIGLMIAGLFNIRLPWHGAARRTYLAAGLGIFFAMTSVYWAAQFIPSGWILVLFGLAPIVTGLLLFEYGQLAARWVRNTLPWF